MKTRIMFVFLAAVALSIVLSAPCGAQPKAKVIELSYSSHFPPNYGSELASMKWAEEIEKRTGGRVKITFYHAGTLTPANANYEGVVKGISDIGHSVFSYTRGRFPLMEVVDLPGYEYNAIVSSLVAQGIYEKFKPKELDDVHVLYLHAHMPGTFAWAKQPVTKLDEFKGKRVRAPGLAVKIVEGLGGVAVSMPKADQYDALQKNIVDGTVGSPNELLGWKLADVAKYTTFAPKVGYVNAMFIVMNKRTWSSLPPDIQKVFTEVSKAWPEYHGKVWNDVEIEGYNYGKTQKHTYFTLEGQELTNWQKAVSHMPDEWIKEKAAKGLPAKEAYEYRQQLIEKLSKTYPSLKWP